MIRRFTTCSRLVSVTPQKSPAISITDGRALSFFLILFKDYNPSYMKYGEIAFAKIRRNIRIPIKISGKTRNYL